MAKKQKSMMAKNLKLDDKETKIGWQRNKHLMPKKQKYDHNENGNAGL